MLKAYIVWSGDDPWEPYCLLVFALDANAARYAGWKVLYDDPEYIEVRARRIKEFDEYASSDDGRTPYCIETNDQLPVDAPDFYDDNWEG